MEKNNKLWASGLLEFAVSLFPKISHHKVAGKVIKADSESVACCWKLNSSRGFLNIESSCFPVFRKRSTMGLTHEHFSKHLRRTHTRTQDSVGEPPTPPPPRIPTPPLMLHSNGSWVTERIRNTLLSSGQKPSLTVSHPVTPPDACVFEVYHRYD